MRRLLISLAALLSLTGAAAAMADGSGPSGSGTTTNQAVVVGTIVSVDKTNGTFVANAFVVPPYDHGAGFGHAGGGDPGEGGWGFGGGFYGHGGTGPTGTTGSTGHWGPGGWGSTGDTGSTGRPGFGGPGGFGPGGFSGGFHTDSSARHYGWGSTGDTGATGGVGPTEPQEQQVTIKVGQSTVVNVGGKTASITDLAAGDRFRASFTGSPSDSLSTLTANPAIEVDANTAPGQRSLYAFVGTVTGTTSTSVTVTVQGTFPSSLAASGSSATFTVGSSTLVLGGSGGFGFSHGSVANIANGDIVAGGLIGAPGQTAAQVEASPLMLLLDLPSSLATGATGSTGTPGTTQSSRAAIRQAELKRAESLLGIKVKKTKKSTHHSKHAAAKH